MARQSIVLLDNTQQQVNVTGPTRKAAGYYGSGKNLHTIAVYANDFSGRVTVQATLASNPCEDDWFYVNLNGYLNFYEFPYDSTKPVGERGVTSVQSFTFDGNFVYIRALVDRTYLPDYQTMNYGQLEKILLNF